MARRAGIAGRGNALAGAPPTGSIAAGRSFAGRSFARLALAGSAFAGLTFAGGTVAAPAFAGRTFAGGAVTAPAPAIAATVQAEPSREAAHAGSVGTAGRGQPDRRDLVEAARRQRERVAESRERRGPAPRFTDTDLPRTDRPRTDRPRTDRPPTDGDRSAVPAGAGAVEAAAGQAEAGKDDPEATPAGDPRDSGREAGTRPGEPGGAEPPATTNGGDAGDTGADAADAEQDSSPEERAAELREKLLDLEAALATLGVSGLPTAPRHPNRFTSPFDAARLRAEQREIRRELADLESRPGDARPRR